MHTDTPGAAARAAFTSLIDYAGLFPPAALSMADALAEYRSARAGTYAWVLGRFIVPASRIAEMLETGISDRIALSVIVDAGSEPRTWLSNVQAILGGLARLRSEEPRIAIEGLEIALPRLLTTRETYDASIGQYAAAVQHAGLGDVPSFVEIPRDKRFDELLKGAMYALSRHRLGAKMRCGGLAPEAFPEPAQIASFIEAAREERVPFKATAGLHHPVRHFNEAAGVTMHGFLNILAAAAIAGSDAPAPDLARIIACEDSAEFHLEDAGLSVCGVRAGVAELKAARSEGFVAYGSCSFSEPIEDLRHLDFI